MECAVTPRHGAPSGMPDSRSVASEISLRADRSSFHSFSPTTSQPRAATKSSTRCFLAMRGTLVLGNCGVVIHKGFGEIVPARSVGLCDEIEIAGLGRSEYRP